MKIDRDAPVGVFDSGIGGLTVAREIMRNLPAEKIVYFGDTARVPYGSKSRETIIGYSRQIIRFLKEQKVKAIVVACNTASAFALEAVQEEFDIPILGVIEAGAKVAAQVTRNKRVGIIGTEGTVGSGIHAEVLKKIDPEITVIGKPCPLFVPLVEEGWTHDPVTVEVASRYLRELQEKDIDLSYLEPEEKLTTIQSALSSSIDQLDAGEFEMAQENLEIIGDHILALQDDVTNEKEAYDEIHVSLQSNLDLVNVIGQELEEIMALYANIKDRFGLEDWTHRFSLAQIQMEDLSNRRDEIQKELKQNQRPSVDVVHGYRKFSEDVNEFHDQVKDMKEMLVGASSDESRAKKQLTKLQLILNEVRLNTVTRHLPSISSQFSADLKEGERLIQRVRVVLDHSPLDVQTLNADLQDAIDFVYKLYNNANNLVGVAVMVENAIVFGNRFRSTHAQMDSDLTRAELCFQNGEYTRALKIAIQAIENMHPGIYEKLVAQKDPAVMNQVQ